MWNIEKTALGRIAVPPFIPPGFAVFCTTSDFPGRLNHEIAAQITDVVKERFGIESTLTTCTQVHSATVRRAQRESGWRECDACDALWTEEPNAALAIKIADCLPVTLVDAAHHVIANVHSGWRGAVGGITARTLEAVVRDSAFDSDVAAAYLGPSIRSCCFEVGEEVVERFDRQFVDRTRGKPHVDLVAFTRGILNAHGITDDRIFDSEMCTRCEGSIFHSYRRDGGGGGRNLAIVAG